MAHLVGKSSPVRRFRPLSPIKKYISGPNFGQWAILVIFNVLSLISFIKQTKMLTDKKMLYFGQMIEIIFM